jgi:hypothetical protein
MGLKSIMWLLSAGWIACIGLSAAPMPDELRAALKTFQAEGTKGWAFTQATEGEGQSLLERFDPRRPEFQRWTLLQKNGINPTAEEARTVYGNPNPSIPR